MTLICDLDTLYDLVCQGHLKRYLWMFAIWKNIGVVCYKASTLLRNPENYSMFFKHKTVKMIAFRPR